MLKRFKGAAIAVSALVLTSGVLYAAGNYSTYPIVGGAAFCVSTVGVNGQAGITGQGGGAAGTSGAYCAQTVPAGPPIVTGSELIPADTGLPGGASPQTVVLTLASLNALPPAYPTFTNATVPNVFTISPNVGKVFIVSSSALSGTQVQMPANPVDGQEIALSSSFTIASLLISPNTGQTIESNSKPTVLTVTGGGSAVPTGYQWIYRAADSTWRRLQ